MTALNSYFESDEAVATAVAAGKHREFIGGSWEELGPLQLEFLKSQGLMPGHRVIDIGAGCFRAGVKLIPYLDPGQYFATDINFTILEAGYEREIVPAGLDVRFPTENYGVSLDFDIAMFDRRFDFGIAQSVFTHLPLNSLVACLNAIGPYFRRHGKFFCTVFIAPGDVADQPFRQRSGVMTRPDMDPFHTSSQAVAAAVADLDGWSYDFIGDWGHPRYQQMLAFTRLVRPIRR